MTLEHRHFLRAAREIGAHGDNDTLPFDIESRFISDCADDLASIAHRFSISLLADSESNNSNKIKALDVFSERLLVPAGTSAFRITTKIHPFWTVYFNGIGIAIAERLEGLRSDRVHSYRFIAGENVDLFDRARSWRAFREAAIEECNQPGAPGFVTQTDISSFYEHVSHHYLENLVEGLIGSRKIALQLVSLLSHFSANRSFGLPVGGQCSRILAELLLNQIDHILTERRLIWRRYVDDYVLLTETQASAYDAISRLSHALADYGISLNKSKTMILSNRHFVDYARTQLGDLQDEAGKLREIDLFFDPYSDSPQDDYESLRQTVETLEVHKLLRRELDKTQPDSFLVAQIGRTLRLHPPVIAIELCRTLLSGENLYAFRASWSTIMKGISGVRANPDFSEVFEVLDLLLDQVPSHSPQLLRAEANVLHYLRTLRFKKTTNRAAFVRLVYEQSSSRTVRRACIDCWRQWNDRAVFNELRNKWPGLSPEEQRLLWLTAGQFGDEGQNFMRQKARGLSQSWSLGVEMRDTRAFSEIYAAWCANAPGRA